MPNRSHKRDSSDEQSHLSLLRAHQQEDTRATAKKQQKVLLDNLFDSSQPRKIRTQLLRTFLPAVLIPLAVASALAYRFSQKSVEKQVEQELASQAFLASEATSQLIKDLEKTSFKIARNPLIIEASRSANLQVREQNLTQLSIPQLEGRFASNKLLQVNRVLNDYLRMVAENEGVVEIFFTQADGLNVASSNLTSDFVQRDEPWWQKGKSELQHITNPDFDKSANSFSVDVVQAIVAPNSEEFLGVLKIVVPSSRFDQLNSLLEGSERHSSQQVQLLDSSSNVVVRTITSTGAVDTQEVIGGEAITTIAEILVRVDNNSESTLEQALNALKSEYSLREVKIVSLPNQRTRKQQTLLSFIYQGKEYSLISLPNLDWVAIASMDYAEIEAAGSNLVWLFLSSALILGAGAVVIILRLAGQLAAPLVDLAQKAELVALGDLDVVAQPRGSIETRTLAQTFNNLVTRVKDSLQLKTDENERIKLLSDISLRLRESLDRNKIFSTAVTETKLALSCDREAPPCDRVLVYLFDEQWQGTVVAESVSPDFSATLGTTIHDPCFAQKFAKRYQRGRILAISDVESAQLQECYLQQLQSLQVKAHLIAPILVAGKLEGLLIAHQCSQPRFWQESEVSSFQQIAIQLGFALEQANLLEQREKARQAAEAVSQEQKQQKEVLQQQLRDLLTEIDGASRGDLTVHAQVHSGEIGTVADFFNFLVESLRQIVTQVKQSAVQVNTYLEENGQAIEQLTQQSLQQAQETDNTLTAVEKMALSMQAAVHSAHEAADVAQTAAKTAQSVGKSMDTTGDKILSLKQSVSQTAEQVKHLGNSSEQIARVVALIDQIASQTNLLALNASIEAARAGKQAQGFAVVAEEIGQLATRCTQATQEIASILATIGEETNQVVTAMEQSTSQVLESTDLVEDAKYNLERIVATSSQINQLMQFIFETTASGVQTSQSISSLMAKIVTVSQGTLDSSHHLRDSLERTIEVSQQLQTSVETFKVE